MDMNYANKSGLFIFCAFCMNHSAFASQREKEEQGETAKSFPLTTQNFIHTNLLLFWKF